MATVSRREVLGATAAAAVGMAAQRVQAAEATDDSISVRPSDSDNLKADVFIVGSGPIASTFARLLHASGRSVLMADSGPQLSRRPGEHLKNAVAWQRDIDKFTPIVLGLLNPLSLPPRVGHTLTLDPTSFQTGAANASTRGALNPRQDPYKNLPNAAQGFAVGGMFVHWTSSVPRQHPTLERMSFIGDDEWDRLYSCGEALVNMHTDAFSKSIRNQVIKERLQQYYKGRLAPPYAPDNLPMAVERRTDNDEFVYYSGSDTILGPLALPQQDGRFRILPEHRVYKLETAGGRVTGAIVDDMIRGKRFSVSADLFIVAGGSIMTPQLLWNSGIRPQALGRYLHEHSFVFTQIVLKDDVVAEMARQGGKGNGPNDPVPVPLKDPLPMLRVPVAEGRPWHTQVHRDSFAFNQALPADVDTRLILDIRSFGMVQPREDNRVYFEDDLTDVYGMPQPTFEYRLAEGDRKLAHAMMIDALGIAEDLGGFLIGSEPRFMPPGASLHLMGTTGMGEADDGKSVIDPYSKVWGFDNLLLGGNGVLSRANACNPTLTAMALAVRAAAKVTGQRPDPASLGMGELRRVVGL
jgi:pyranose oxidase